MTKKASFIIPTVIIKSSFSYKTDADIPLPQLSKPIISAFLRPDQVIPRIKNEGGEGLSGVFSSGLAQLLGSGSGATLGAALTNRSKSKLAKALSAGLGSYLGIGTGGAAANLMHNSESKAQFAKALQGALSTQDKSNLPSGLIALIEKGEADKFKELAEQTIPGISERPYIKQILKSQNPV